MNPLVITGTVAIAVLASAMLATYSDLQLEHSHTSQQVSNIQAQRLQEDVSVEIRDDRIILENKGPVPVRIMEIRIIDDDGHVVAQQKSDLRVAVAAQETQGIGPEISTAFENTREESGQ